jgi:hypothetical protein
MINEKRTNLFIESKQATVLRSEQEEEESKGDM